MDSMNVMISCAQVSFQNKEVSSRLIGTVKKLLVAFV